MNDGPVATFVPPGSETRPSFRTEFPCTLLAARDAAMELRRFLPSEGLSETELDAWELATVEVANNAVNYVRDSARETPFVVEAAVGESHVDGRVWDHTDGFEMPENVELPEFEDEGGRGLFLIKTLTDSAEYLRGKSANCFALSKARTEPARHL
jgi:anti-sigma regulatory factor (Ser/Thr protein kinase)